MKVDVLDINGKATGRSVELADEVFGIEPNEHVVYLAVKGYLARQRTGTHKTKERGEIRGSTRKIRRQKGTGGARFGDIKSPILRGGGRIFGPRPHKYGYTLNKKERALARRSALALKAKAEGVLVVEDLKMDAPKTKDYMGMLTGLGLAKDRSLYVVAEDNKNVTLSGRNIPNTEVARASDIHPYQIMKAAKIVLSESSVSQLNENLVK